MQETCQLGLVSLIAVLLVVTLPPVSFGQIPTLDKLNIENSEQQQQCLDFNKDKICEFIVLANEEAAADSDIDNDSNDNGNDCQSQDDFCDNDEGCESESVDCIDDRGFDEDDYNG